MDAATQRSKPSNSRNSQRRMASSRVYAFAALFRLLWVTLVLLGKVLGHAQQAF